MAINLNQLKSKAQDVLSKNSDKIEQGLDKASGMAKSRFGKQSDKIDTATRKAKSFLQKNAGGGDGHAGPSGQQPPPQP
ncbi:antitoxin [Saccharomonospora sp.]|uniref:antitoxin n=1 Tax=Saccharomonospora sp. TaxID=33913 RepID=UPI002606A7D8|nr:antitoxin [Saccharomonospora sp.]